MGRLLVNNHTKNIFFSLLPGLLSILVAIFSIPIFLNYLDHNLYAQYIFQHLLLSIGLITNFNIGKIITLKLNSITNKKNIIFSTVFYIVTLNLFLFIFFLLLFFLIKKNFYPINSIISLASGIAFTSIFINSEYILRYLNKYKYSGILNFFFYSLSISLPSLFLFIDINNFQNYIFEISVLIKFIVMLITLFIIFKYKKIYKSRINLNLYKYFIHESKYVTFVDLINHLYNYLDKYLIKVFLGPLALILFTIPQQISAKISVVSSGFIAAMITDLSKNLKKIKNKFSSNLYIYFYLMLFLLLIILPFIENFLKIWLRNSFDSQFIILFKLFIIVSFLGSLSQLLNALNDIILKTKNNFKIEMSVFPFFVAGLILSVFSKNIYFFVFLLILKEFFLINYRIYLNKFLIDQWKLLILNTNIFVFIYFSSILEFKTLTFLLIIFLVYFNVRYKKNIKLLIKEFFN